MLDRLAGDRAESVPMAVRQAVAHHLKSTDPLCWSLYDLRMSLPKASLAVSQRGSCGEVASFGARVEYLDDLRHWWMYGEEAWPSTHC